MKTRSPLRLAGESESNHSTEAPKELENCADCPGRDDNPLCSVEKALDFIQNSVITSHFKPDQVIFYAGNEPLGLYNIQSGLVKLETVSEDGSAHTLRLMGPGQALGYRALFANEPYHASAIAVAETKVCFIPKSVLMQASTTQPEVALNLMKRLSTDLRTAEEKWIQQIDKDAGSRIAETLLFLDENFPPQSWTRREIAEWAGTSPETVIRTLAHFEKESWIQPEGRRYKILNREKLIEKAKT